MNRRTRGYSLLELLVALPLIAIVGAVCVQLLLGVHRRTLHDDGALGATREMRHGAGVLVSELRGLRAEDLIAWSDTAIEFEATVGVAIVCATSSSRTMIVLAGSAAEPTPALRTPLDPVWNTAPQAGDLVDVQLANATLTHEPLRRTHALQHTSSSTQCATSPLSTTNSATALGITDTLAWQSLAGTPVRVRRRTRYSLYRASDGDWFLGRRTRGPSGWDVIQPVAGPLLAARDRGLIISVLDGAGNRVSAPSALAARVSLQLRAPRRTGRAAVSVPTIDSATVDVALHADRSDAS